MNQQYYVDIISALAERTIKRLWIVILVLIVLLVASNVAWKIYDSQFATEEVSQEVDTGNGDAFVVGIGDVEYGTGTTDSTPQGAPNGR